MIGIDRLSVSFIVKDFDVDPTHWFKHDRGYGSAGLVSESYSRTVVVGEGVTAYVGVRGFYPRGPLTPVYGKVEFNPSRVALGEGVGLATVDDTIDSLVSVMGAASTFVVPEYPDELHKYNIKRLDVAKDFSGVLSPSALIRGLAPVQRKWARRNLVHADPARSGAQTLMVGGGAGVVRLYDKFAESKGVAPEGSLRWEAECRSDWVQKYGGFGTLEGLSKSCVDGLASNRWNWSAMGVEVSSTAGVIDVVARETWLTPRERTMFIGWLVQQGTDYAYEPSSATVAKFRALQRKLNVAVGPEAIGSVGFKSRLDWESGSELLSVG